MRRRELLRAAGATVFGAWSVGASHRLRGAQDAPRSAAEEALERGQNVVITVVYDNYRSDGQLKTAWGFACVIEGLPETILFDTGGDGELLLSNLAKRGFRPEQVGCIVLSHFHRDHTGGLKAVLKANSGVRVYMPKVFPSDFQEEAARSGAAVVGTEAPCRVCDGAWTTGVLGDRPPEQGLYLRTARGLVVVTGCAHPGIARMAQAARDHGNAPVAAVLGGFHMAAASADQIDTVVAELKNLGARQAAPSHCSGDKTRQRMKEAFGEGYLPSGVGARLVFSKQD